MFRTPFSNDLLTAVLLLCLLLIVAAKYINSKRLFTYFGILLNSHYVNRYSKDLKLFDYFNVTIYLVFNLISAAVIFQIIKNNFSEFNDFQIYSSLFIAIFVFFGLKLSLEIGLSKLLNVESFFKPYLFRKISYRHFFGILIIPCVAFFAYHDFFTKKSIYWFTASIGVLYLISYVILIKPFFEKIKQNMFYFILYLCALEISPYVILYKLII